MDITLILKIVQSNVSPSAGINAGGENKVVPCVQK
jgi:hypothetical protein